MKHVLLSAVAVCSVLATRAGGQDLKAADAQEILNRTWAAYRDLATYQDRVTIEVNMELEDGDHAMAGTAQQDPRVIELIFERPNRILFEQEESAVYCDGTHLWQVINLFGQYEKSDAPDALREAGLFGYGQGSAILWGHPALVFLLSDADSLEEEMSEFDEVRITGAQREPRDGRDGYRVTFAMQAGMILGSDEPIMMSLWIDDEDGLVREMRTDMAAAMNAMAAEMAELAGEDDPRLGGMSMPTYTKMETVSRVDDLVLDAPIPAERFVFEPGKDDVEAEDGLFGGMIDMGGPRALIGEPAPGFVSVDLDGEAVSLSEYEGRVVVLDFWATWCAPCVVAIPHIQALAERFADQEVTVLGINRDYPGSEQRIRRVLEKKGVTFRQVMDTGGQIASEYRVSSIPCTIIIGQDGLVQDASVGFLPGQGEEHASDITRLLNGEPLFDPEELADDRRGGARPAHATGTLLQAVDSERLVDAGHVPGHFTGGHQAILVDLDGDGADEVVMPSMYGGLTVISADAATTSRIQLEDLQAPWVIQQLQLVGEDETAGWLVLAMQWSQTGQMGSSGIGMFDREGNRLWWWAPELPENTICSMFADSGDLDGDGDWEIAVGLSAIKMRKTDRANLPLPQKLESYLAVLDRGGEVISLRRVGQQLERIWIAEPAEPGQPSQIVTMGDGRVMRFTLEETR